MSDSGSDPGRVVGKPADLVFAELRGRFLW